MKRYLVRRALYTVPTILAVVVLSFFLIRLAPGDPTLVLAGEGSSPEYRDWARQAYGLDKPFHEQLAIYVWNLLQGNLGRSYVFKEPVLNVILERVPATILLVATGLSIAVTLGVLLGLVSAGRPYSIRDNAIMSWSITTYSLPVFWVAQLLVLVFSIWLRLFPVTGMSSARLQLSGLEYAIDVLWHLILPSTSLAMVFMALFARLTRTSVLEAMRMNYILTARAKGLKRKEALSRHALPNAMLPVVTVLGVQFGLMIAGAVLTETVFAWPGVGRLLTDAVYFRDYPVVTGVFVLVTMSVIVANLITDLIYTVLDPRIRYA
mgnify:CR=1 FL=1